MTLQKNPIYCALDTNSIGQATQWAEQTKEYVGGFKIGMNYFYAHGEEGYRAIADIGKPIFLDLKLYDIPNTVYEAVKTLCRLKPAILNVHASGGIDMMKKAVEAANEAENELGYKPIMIAVTLLTSFGRDSLLGEGKVSVNQLRHDAVNAAMDGIVCAGEDITSFPELIDKDFHYIVPGIRPVGSKVNEQKRIMTPPAALKAGADILVIGRPITHSDSPAETASAIWDSIKNEC